MSEPVRVGRTYNQNHVPRHYTPGKRRFSIYWTWSYPWEANRDVTELDNRFSTMTEVRRVGWPGFEASEWDKMHFLQGIAGTLEYKIPKRPIRKKITGLPAFTTVKGGAYFFLPGLKALRYLATLSKGK